MKLILSDIHNLDQHISTFLYDPERYRPERCPHCGRSGLWIHGAYWRNAACEKGVGCSAPVPRFYCPHEDCHRTCSVLPEYISPRRWYHWAMQQIVFTLMALGYSLMDACNQIPKSHLQYPQTPDISTIYRWWQSLQAQFLRHHFHLCSQHSELGRYQGCPTFWQACLKRMFLSTAMTILNRAGHKVP
jgi:hypothetical protein